MGFNWLSFYHIFHAFSDKITSYDSAGFNWFKNFTYDWTHTWNYGAEITKVSYGVASVIGGLPLPLVYLMGVGFAVTIVLVIVRIVVDLL